MAGGRPNKYDTQLKPYIKYIGLLRKEGMLYREIAEMLNIAESTLRKHKTEIEEFSAVIKNSDEFIVDKSEASLYQLAWGMAKQKKEKILYDAEGNIKGREVTIDTLPPSVPSNIFILTNRAQHKWSNTQNVTVEEVKSNLTDRIKEAKETLGL